MIRRIFKASVLTPYWEEFERGKECVFIDDTEKNVLGANAVGITGIVFTSYEDAVSKLNELGLLF